MNEHWNPTFAATQWTTKYPVVEFVCTFPVGSYRQTLKVEHRVTERLMAIYGLDGVRGGNFVMGREGGDWWVPPRLQHVPRFTKHWFSLDEHSFVAALRCDPFLSAVKSRHQFDHASQLPVKHEQDVTLFSGPKLSS